MAIKLLLLTSSIKLEAVNFLDCVQIHYLVPFDVIVLKQSFLKLIRPLFLQLALFALALLRWN